MVSKNKKYVCYKCKSDMIYDKNWNCGEGIWFCSLCNGIKRDRIEESISRREFKEKGS